jgi:hypothetical protein
MNKVLSTILIAAIICSCSSKNSSIKSNDQDWNIKKREQFLKNRNDSTTWNTEKLELDIQHVGIGHFGPF